MGKFRRARARAVRGTSVLAAMTMAGTMTVATVAVTSGSASAAHGVVDRAAFGVSAQGEITVAPLPNCAPTTVLGQCEKEAAGVAEAGLSTGLLQVGTTGTHDPLKADSEASVTEAALSLDGRDIFAAQMIKSTCTANENGVVGGTVLADADFFGEEPPEPFDAAEPPPNTIAVDRDRLRILLNEQVVSDGGQQIVVNAVHVMVFDPVTGDQVQDIVLGSTQCSYRAADAPAAPAPGFGYLEICKRADHSQGRVGGRFTFRFAGRSVRVPVGACSGPVRVPAGRLAVREIREPGIWMEECRTSPVQRLVRCDPRARTTVVRIAEGGVRRETTLFVTNRRVNPAPDTSPLKVCKVAGPGVRVGERFAFTVGGRRVTVPAGPANQGGFCKVLRGFEVGNPVRITEAARAGVRVSRIVVRPTDRRLGSSTDRRTALVRIGRGFTVVSFTNTRR